MESSHSRFYGVFPFFLLFIPVFFILGCDLFNHSMVDYFLDNTEVVEVSGIGGRSEYAVMSNGIILIPPASSDEPVSILEAALSNPQNIAVRYQLLGAPSEKNITIRQAGSTKMELVIEGAELDDEFDLTLVMQSADGLRDFASYNMRIRCVSFDTGLSGFRVNEIHPVFDQGSFTVKLPYETEEVTLEGIALEPAASLKLFRGQDAAGTLIASASHKVAGTVHLEVGNNFFYLEVRMSGAVQGYAINVIRMQDSKKLITEFYLTVNSKHYGVGSGVEPGSGSIDGADIAVTVPYETALTSLAPVVVVSGGASSNPASGAARNFTSSQTYTVTAEDGTTQDYTVTVNVAKIASVTAVTGNLTSPNGFKKTGSDISAAIKAAITSVTGTDSLGTAIILAEADYSVDPLTPATAGGNVTATLRVPSAKTSSGTDIITNFPVYIKNDAKAITEFYFTVNSTNYGVGSWVEAGSGSISGTDITVTVPYKTDRTSLAPVVAVFGGASSNPASGVARDFTSSQTYTVTAEDGTYQDYTVTVLEHKGLTISGITVEGLGVFTFTLPDPDTTTVSPGAEITIVLSGGTPTDWYIEISGPENSNAAARIFNMPTKQGFYNINVFATINNIPYSGSFGLIVE